MRDFASAWQRFWFQPEETSTLALVRVAFGLVVLAWTLSLGHDGRAFFSASGILPDSEFPGRAGAAWGVLDLFDRQAAVTVVLVVLALASICLVVGQWTRVAALVVFVGVLSLERRNPFVFNAGDGLLRITALFMVLAPAGASLSFDRWRTKRCAFWEFPSRAPWALRLMQIQLTVVYLSGLWAKLRTPEWNDGTAISYASRLDDLTRFALPGWIATSELLVNLLTYGTLAVEAAIGILVWNRRLRPVVLAFGLALHVGIDLTIRVGFFSYAVFVLYLAFIPSEWASARLSLFRDALAARGRRAAIGRP
jgi:hypothetical protein